MSRLQELIQTFRAFTSDYSSDDAEIKKYLEWGKNNIEMAVNYYFQKKEKVKQKPSSSLRAQPVLRSKTSSTGTVVNATQVLKQAAIREKKTEEFINKVKQDYQLPLKKNGYKETQVESSDKQLTQLDYLPEVMNYEGVIEEERQNKDIREYTDSGPSTRSKTLTVASKKQLPLPFRPSCKMQLQEKPVAGRSQEVPVQQKLQKKPILEPRTYEVPKINDQLEELFIGETIVQCFSTSKTYVRDCPAGSPLVLKPHITSKQDKQKEKKNKFKKPTVDIVVWIYYGGVEIGRFENQEGGIFNPLLAGEFVRLEVQTINKLGQMSVFMKFSAKCRVYLLKKAITEPIIENFEANRKQNQILQMYADVRESLISLFKKLNLEILTEPLVRLKSKYSTNNNTVVVSSTTVQKVVDASTKNNRALTDPFYKEKQMNLSEAFKVKRTSTTDMNKTAIQKSATQPRPAEADHRQVKLDSHDQQDNFEQLVNLNDNEIEPAEPGKKFRSIMHEYQSKALGWMLQREGVHGRDEPGLHPMWIQFRVPQREQDLSIFFNEFTGQISIMPPVFKSVCRGGILADEMGLGKTVMMIGLITTNFPPDNYKKFRTLIVVPLSLLDQWDDEIQNHSKGLRVAKYYQKKDRGIEFKNFDVVITTYGVVSHQFSKGFHLNNKGLFANQWFRVILDEAHYIKGRVIQTSRAVFALKCINSWCLTGTPIQNKLDDLFALVHFIKYTPWSDHSWWNAYINKPHEQGDNIVFEVLRTILKKVFLRRTKQTKDKNGKNIVNLPHKQSVIWYLKMNQKEREFYDSVYEASRMEFDQLVRMGVLEAKYMAVFQILVRLRQICCHPSLFKSVSKFSSKQKFGVELKKWIQKRISAKRDEDEEEVMHYEPVLDEEENEEKRVEVRGVTFNEARFSEALQTVQKEQMLICPVCLDPCENPVITVCLHFFCKTCILEQLMRRPKCPGCRTELNKQDLLMLPRENRLAIDFKTNFYLSTKLQKVISIIIQLSIESKAVIFTQFLGMMDLIEHLLNTHEIGYVRLDGSLTQKQRSEVIDIFQKDPTCKVFLISLKAGGVGLNLTMADTVILVDPWWNPAVEDQAIERVHRLGQKREVKVYRLIMQNTIENRMMELHQTKKRISNLAMANEVKQNNMQKLRYLMERY